MFPKKTTPLLGALALVLAAAPAIADGYRADVLLDEGGHGCSGGSWESGYAWSDNESYGYGRDVRQGAACAESQRDAAVHVRSDDGAELVAIDAGSDRFQAADSASSESAYGSPWSSSYDRRESSGSTLQSSRGASARVLDHGVSAREECLASDGSDRSEASRSDSTSYGARRSASAHSMDGCTQRASIDGLGVALGAGCRREASSWSSDERTYDGSYRSASSGGESETCGRSLDAAGYALVASDGCSAWRYSQQDAWGSYASEDETCWTGAAVSGPTDASVGRRQAQAASCDATNGCYASQRDELVVTSGATVIAFPLP